MARVISFHYTLTDAKGAQLDSSKGGEPFSFMEGVRQIIPGLEREVIKMLPGAKKKIPVAAADAYGLKNEALVVKVARTQLPDEGREVQVGDRFKGGAEENAPVYTVVNVTDADVELDGNHPLAGVDLEFDIEVTAVREATEEEISHGHAHGPEGHGHHH